MSEFYVTSIPRIAGVIPKETAKGPDVTGIPRIAGVIPLKVIQEITAICIPRIAGVINYGLLKFDGAFVV